MEVSKSSNVKSAEESHFPSFARRGGRGKGRGKFFVAAASPGRLGEVPVASSFRGGGRAGRGRGNPLQIGPTEPQRNLTVPAWPATVMDIPGSEQLHVAPRKVKLDPWMTIADRNGYFRFIFHMGRINNLTLDSVRIDELIDKFDADWRAMPGEERTAWKEKTGPPEPVTPIPIEATSSGEKPEDNMVFLVDYDYEC
ncbi:unnamed protein product [Orchesella dallaii]|uniref:Uncharacterized protein n=1 Tax=Orchesella dallaii TaxID=48710 RepID=A0ABP1QIS8_9HEXA